MNQTRLESNSSPVMLILVKYYDPSRQEDVHCHDCGWQGLLHAAFLNPSSGVRDFRCPCCSAMLAMVSDSDKVADVAYRRSFA